MGRAPLPPFAAWRHTGTRQGFEIVLLRAGGGGLQLEGHTTAVLDGEPFALGYAIELDGRWRTRAASLAVRGAAEARHRTVEADGEGAWLLDGRPAPELDGCLDLDLELSALTNAFPVHRLGLAPGAAADAPAAWVRAVGDVERLEQRYRRLPGASPERYAYAAPALGFTAELVYDAAGLVVDYPSIATRAAP